MLFPSCYNEQLAQSFKQEKLLYTEKKRKMGNYLYLLLDKIEEIAQVAGKINAVNRKCPIFLHVYH